MKHAVLLIACALPLAGCNKSPEIHETNVSVAEVAQKARDAGAGYAFVRPGKWQVTGVFEAMEMPGLPAQSQTYIKQSMARASNHKFEYCLTPEEAKRPRGKFFTGKESPQCHYDRFDLGGGKLDAVMRCEHDGGTQIMEMSGTYTPDSYTTHVSMKMEGGRQSGMVMKMRSEARRIGECTGKEHD